MWPFKKKLPIDALNADEGMWTIKQGTTGDGVMLVSVNATAKRWARHPALGIRVGFAIPLNDSPADSDTASAMNFSLYQIEDNILSRLRSSGPAIHALTITTGTFKEFVFYIQNGDSIGSIHERIKTESPSHEVQCYAENDPKWTVYDSFSQ